MVFYFVYNRILAGTLKKSNLLIFRQIRDDSRALAAVFANWARHFETKNVIISVSLIM